jgi:hypothetical protein
MTKETTVNKAIADAVTMGTERDMIVVDLIQNHAQSLHQATKAVAAYYKEHGLTTQRAGGFIADFRTWLVDADPTKPRTAAQVEKYIKDNGTANTERNKNHYIGEAEAVAAAFAKGLAAAQ